MRPLVTALIVLACSQATVAAAQTAAESARSRLIVARNQLGLVQYCQGQGMAGQGALAGARAQLARLPPQPGVGDAEAEAGLQGIVAFGLSHVSLAADAAAEGTTLHWRCVALGELVQAAP